MGMYLNWARGSANERICSVTTGLVKNNWDKEHPGMVQAEYFLGTKGKNVTGWIPVASPYAYKGCGMYTLPEIGSEVVIAFNMGDRNCPIVIGCLWNKKNPLPEKTAQEKNMIRRFKTKGGCEVIFDDEKGKESIEIHTPKKLTFHIDDEKEKITISDEKAENGLVIEAKEGKLKLLAKKGLVLQAGDKVKLTLDSSGAVTLKGDSVKVEATKSYALKSQTVKLEGTQTDVKGSSKLSVQSGGMTQVKGATVKIN